ncbi:TonB-dependent receptor [Arcicella aquatica]|uniref:TonB-dependent receptor n=1 Tax=Arcicella aquatica TaxID=217141 RepID=A0ABU5QMJ8_9BACT|nr:TonB-dependent receptor [Arcicella aquatica]MEA5258296.1 TonB-dependent receptor [Arcicella aquatica]
MKKILLSLTLFSLICTNLFAQFPVGGMGGMGGGRPKEATAIPGTAQAAPKGSAKITGYIIDSSATKAVEFASVALLAKATNKPVDGTVCDEKGKFTLAKVATGDYVLAISFLGYHSKRIDVKIVNKNDDIDLGVIKLSQTSQVLQEVTVEGQRSLIEDKVDRMVYNAEKDATNKGGDATDVLRKVPSLSVDLDGNVTLRGSQNVKVLINNKPSTIVASSIADALKQIPSDMIKSVEVITSPSAKYDAEGSSGIINIITKKNTLQGLTLNLDSSVGIRGANMSLNGNYRKGNMGFSLGGFGRSNYNVNGEFVNTQLAKSDGTITKQSASTRNDGLFGSYQFGWDWDINKSNSITASARYGARNQNTFQDALSTNIIRTNGSNTTTVRDVETKDNSGTIDLNVDYTHTFKKPQQELSLSAQYSRNDRKNNFTNIIYGLSDSLVQLGRNRISNINPSYNQETTLQADYQSPIGKTQMIEFGGKGIFRKVNSTFTQVGNNGALDYDQNIAASYFSYTLTTKQKYSFKGGVRYEHTDINAIQTTEGGAKNNIDIPSYGTLVPSFNVSKSLKGGTTLKLAYNRRIQRPSLQFLNPNRNASNPSNVTEGNPNLSPEFTNNYEFTINTFFKNTFLTTALFMRNTTGSIQSIRTNEVDAQGRPFLLTSYRNIGNEDAYGMNLFGSVNISNKFQLGGGTDIYYAVLNNNNPDPLLNAKNQGWVASFRMFGSYNLSKGWGFQAFSFYRGNQVQLQGSQGGFGIYSLSIKKDLANKKGSIGFGAENFFTPNGFKINNNIESSTISQQSTTTLRNMNFKINFSYRIGKMSFDAPKKRKKSVNNDDLKDGGDGGGNGGGQQQQAAPATTGGGGGRPR